MITFSEVKKKCSKKTETLENHTFAQIVYRKTSMYFTYPFILMRLSPNSITNFMTLVGIVSTLFFMTGNYFYGLIGIVLWQFRMLLDFIDGNVARYWKRTSIRGIYLDTLSHSTTDPLLRIALGIGIFARTNNIIYLYMGIAISIMNLVTQVLHLTRNKILTDYKITEKSKIIQRKVSSSTPFITRLLKNTYIKLFDYRFYILTLLVFIDQIRIYLIAYTIFATLKLVMFSYLYSIYPEKNS